MSTYAAQFYHYQKTSVLVIQETLQSLSGWSYTWNSLLIACCSKSRLNRWIHPLCVLTRSNAQKFKYCSLCKANEKRSQACKKALQMELGIYSAYKNHQKLHVVYKPMLYSFASVLQVPTFNAVNLHLQIVSLLEQSTTQHRISLLEHLILYNSFGRLQVLPSWGPQKLNLQGRLNKELCKQIRKSARFKLLSWNSKPWESKWKRPNQMSPSLDRCILISSLYIIIYHYHYCYHYTIISIIL